MRNPPCKSGDSSLGLPSTTSGEGSTPGQGRRQDAPRPRAPPKTRPPRPRERPAEAQTPVRSQRRRMLGLSLVRGDFTLSAGLERQDPTTSRASRRASGFSAPKMLAGSPNGVPNDRTASRNRRSARLDHPNFRDFRWPIACRTSRSWRQTGRTDGVSLNKNYKADLYLSHYLGLQMPIPPK
jgi:hypothetical protein